MGVRTIRRIRTMLNLLRRRLVGSLRRRRLLRRRGVGEDGGAAERAGGVEAEPRVDAARVEWVPTPREQAALVAVRELRDADRALGRRRRRPGAAATTGRGRGVDEDGQRGDGQLHLAPVSGLGRRRRRGGHRRRVVVVVLAAAAAGARAREEAPEVDVDEEDEEDVERDEARREQPPVCLPVDAAGARAGAHGLIHYY